jgi:FtsH-binding integral membrane protein
MIVMPGGRSLLLAWRRCGARSNRGCRMFHVYTQSSITRVFFISAAAVGALSIGGYTTQRNLSGFGTFLFIGLIGIIIASLVNLFLRSSGLDWMIGVLAGLTAYDTQRIKGVYDRGDDATSAGRKLCWAHFRSTSTSSTCS